MNKEEYIVLLETMNTVDLIEWNKTNKDFEWGPFRVKVNNNPPEQIDDSDLWFIVQIIYRTNIDGHVVPEFKNARIGEISFVDADAAASKGFDTSKKAGFNSLKVYSIVGHALLDKLNSEYDVLYFDINSANSNNETEYVRKLRLPTMVAKKLITAPGVHYYELKNKKTIKPASNKYIVSKIKLSDESENLYGLIHPLKEGMKIVGLDVGHFNL